MLLNEIQKLSAEVAREIERLNANVAEGGRAHIFRATPFGPGADAGDARPKPNPGNGYSPVKRELDFSAVSPSGLAAFARKAGRTGVGELA